MKNSSLTKFAILTLIILFTKCSFAQEPQDDVDAVRINLRSGKVIERSGRVTLKKTKELSDYLVIMSGANGAVDTIGICDLSSLEVRPCDSLKSFISREERISNNDLSISTYPNPSSSLVKIIITSKAACVVQVVILDLIGAEVKVYEKISVLPGENQLVWDTSEKGALPISSGKYFIRVTTDDTTLIQSQMIVK